jgi:hypothetical protein
MEPSVLGANTSDRNLCAWGLHLVVVLKWLNDPPRVSLLFGIETVIPFYKCVRSYDLHVPESLVVRGWRRPNCLTVCIVIRSGRGLAPTRGCIVHHMTICVRICNGAHGFVLYICDQPLTIRCTRGSVIQMQPPVTIILPYVHNRCKMVWGF